MEITQTVMSALHYQNISIYSTYNYKKNLMCFPLFLQHCSTLKASEFLTFQTLPGQSNNQVVNISNLK